MTQSADPAPDTQAPDTSSPETKPRAPLWLAVAVLALPPLFWAGNFIVGRAVRDDISPVMLSFLRSVLAFVVLLPFAWKHVRAQADWYRAHWVRVVLVGFCGVTMFNTVVYYGLHYTTATNGVLMNSTIPMWILIFGAIFWGRPIRGVQVLGLAISTVGVATIILQGDLGRLLALQFAPGDPIILIAMIGWGFYTLGLSTIPAQINRLGLLLVHLGLAVGTLLPLLVLCRGQGPGLHLTPASVAAVLYVGIVASLIALILFMRAVGTVGPALAGQAIHLMPLYGAILSAVFLGETLHPYHGAGIAAILVGIVVASRGRPKAA